MPAAKNIIYTRKGNRIKYRSLSESQADRTFTFADVAGQWLSVLSKKVKPSTHAEYAAALIRHILPPLGEKNIQTLTEADINRFATDKLCNGRIDGSGGLAPKTVCDMLSIIKSVVDFAREKRIINDEFAIDYPKQQRQKMRVLTRQEQSLLESVLLKNLDVYKLGILLCLYTGLRIGEVCALRWKDISEDFNTLSVRQTLQRIKNINEGRGKTKILVGTPKSQCSVRDIPIPKFLASYISEFSRYDYAYFLSTSDFEFVEPRTMQNHFMRHVKVAKIAAANFHSLRHTFATRCIEAGVDIKSLSEMLGHANVNITLNRYVHSSFEQKRKGISQLEQYIWG